MATPDNPMHDQNQSSAEVDGLLSEEEAGTEGTSMPEETCPGKGTGEVQVLIEQQQADKTLAGLRKCAEKGEDGYIKKRGSSSA